MSHKTLVQPPSLFKNSFFLIFTILALVFLSYSYSIQNQFITWDDPTHVTRTELTRSLDFQNITKMFSSYVGRTYIPLTLLSFAVEHHFVGFDPFFYHLNNLLLHLFNVSLVFILARMMRMSLLAAYCGALIFGLHPMHVENVAWVTARKDLLYGAFYLLALLSYWKFLSNGKLKFYLLCLLFGLLSISSKPMALSLPLVLCLFDWFKEGRFSYKRLLEKLPFFVIISAIAWLTYRLNARIIDSDGFHNALLFIWSSTFYIKKFFMPFILIPLYEVPKPISIFNFSYISGAIIFVGLIGLLIKWRSKKWFVFAICYYVLSNFFLFRYDQKMDITFVADRYMYVSSLGLSLFIGVIFERLISLNRGLGRRVMCLLVSLVFLGMGVKCYQMTKVWENDFSLWSYIIEKNPHEDIAYLNRGNFYKDQKEYHLAIKDFDRSIALNPTKAEVFINRGNAYSFITQFDAALADYDKAIAMDPSFDGGYANRGIIYAQQGDYEAALLDFSKSLKYYPNDAVVLMNRGNIYINFERMDDALQDYNKALLINSNLPLVYYNRSRLYLKEGELKKALRDAIHPSLTHYPGINAYIQDIQKRIQLKNNT